MNTTTLAIALAAVLGCLTLSAQETPRPAGGGLAERFKQLDRNGDGKLTAEEVPFGDYLKQWDADGDGAVTLDEIRKFYVERWRRQSGQPAPAATPADAQPAAMPPVTAYGAPGAGTTPAVSATARGGVAPPWPQFRGPGGAGVAHEGIALPVTWSATENVVWAAAIPGKGWSSPIVWGDRVFLTTVIGPGDAEPPPAPETLTFRDHVEGVTTQAPHRWVVLCLDRQSGRIVWQQTAHAGVPSWPIHPKNGYASETPVTDGERVYAQFGNVGLFCYDLDGNKVWAREWTPVRMGWNWGPAASPVLHGERIYVVNDNEEKSYLLALDKRTGRDVWRVDRDEKSNWANPFVWAHDARTELVTAGSGAVRSYGLDGMLLWQLSGMSSVTVPTPVATHGLLFVSSGCNHSRQRPVYAIRPGAQGDISLGAGQTSNEFIAWCQPLAAPYVPSPVVQGDCLCVLNDQGTLGCYDARSGKEVYARQRVGKGPFSASPWADARHVYCLNEAGDTFVMAAGPEFRAVGCNRLGETCLATPAISGNSLLLRTLTRLYRIETHAPP